MAVVYTISMYVVHALHTYIPYNTYIFTMIYLPTIRVFGAIAKTNPITLGGSISLVDIHTSYDTSSLESKADEEYSQFDSFCPYTSLTFNSNQEVLVAGRNCVLLNRVYNICIQ